MPPIQHFGIKISGSGSSSPSPSPSPAPSPAPSYTGWVNALQSVTLNQAHSYSTGSSNSVWFSNNPNDVEDIMCLAADPNNLDIASGNTIGISALEVGGSIHQFTGWNDNPTSGALFGGTQIFILEYPVQGGDSTFHINNPYYNDLYKYMIGYERTYVEVRSTGGYITSVSTFTSCAAPIVTPQPATSFNAYIFERLTGLGFDTTSGKSDSQVLRDAQNSGNLITDGSWPGFAYFGETQNVLNKLASVPYGPTEPVATSVWPTGFLTGNPVVGAQLLDNQGNPLHYPNGVINYHNGTGSNWYLIRTNSGGYITSVSILYRPF